jgi:tetratricopeptide (TPR) repeat protein
MLIVLDNARDADQVRPLLPGGSGCMVLITSRAQLTGLVALEGARARTLGVLSRSEARQMVAQRLGAGRAAADQEATDLLADACARLPLALAIATALIATRPGHSISSVARELTQAAHGLDTLDAGEVTANLRTVIDWSYEALTAPAARMFCLLAEHPGPDIGVPAAASLTATGADQARDALLELVRANLVTEHGDGRFAFHDLLRQYAASRLKALHSPADRAAACYRVLDHYLQTATAAALVISPGRALPGLRPPSAGTQPEPIAGQDEAFAWLRTEHAVLMRVTTYAAEAGADAHACQIPRALTDFHDRTGRWHDWAAGQRIALAAAQRLGDIAAQASAHRYLGRACFHLQHHDQAVDHLTRALDLQHHLDQPAAEAGISIDLSRMHEQRGNHAEALQSAQRALALYEAIQHRVGVASALNSAGWYYALLGKYPAGLRYCERALEQAMEIGHPVIEAQAWDSIGFIHQHMTQPVQAISCHQRSAERLRELGDRHQLTRALHHLGDAHQAAGDHNAAIEAWAEALTILDDLHHPDADQVRAKIAAHAAWC